jgi:hypothetical protein
MERRRAPQFAIFGHRKAHADFLLVSMIASYEEYTDLPPVVVHLDRPKATFASFRQIVAMAIRATLERGFSIEGRCLKGGYRGSPIAGEVAVPPVVRAEHVRVARENTKISNAIRLEEVGDLLPLV